MPAPRALPESLLSSPSLADRRRTVPEQGGVDGRVSLLAADDVHAERAVHCVGPAPDLRPLVHY